jgi:hypothetical protein
MGRESGCGILFNRVLERHDADAIKWRMREKYDATVLSKVLCCGFR